MPSRAPRRCTTPGCAGQPDTASSTCPSCGRRRRRARPSATAQGYNAEHRDRFRAGVLARDTVCVVCQAAPSAHADHHPLSKRELRARGMDEHDPRHGRGLCQPCHSRETARAQPAGWHAAGAAR
ncbi:MULTISPECIES: hypothetical protein [Protofrankia]|uniref:hypothetical protein n=1 Tax=Protofrankia TaxID=2994361 RepID=UPI0006407300|nr:MULTISPECIES: hypothetical protein [Protofrankia]ONH35763.1 hypothetical protein BL254_10450 [Protofrankia sp. BMG5.30]